MNKPKPNHALHVKQSRQRAEERRIKAAQYRKENRPEDAAHEEMLANYDELDANNAEKAMEVEE